MLGRGAIYSIDLSRTLVEHLGWTCSGSSSSYVLGFIDANFSSIRYSESNEDSSAHLWNEDEAVDFVTKAIELAMDTDGSSGRYLRVFIINQDGEKVIVHILCHRHQKTTLEFDILVGLYLIFQC